MTSRSWAIVTFVALLVVLAVAAVLLVPWHRPPAPRADQLAALRELPSDRVAQARALKGELRWIGYPSMALGLIFALLLGLTPLGARIVGAVPGPWLVKAVAGGLLVL